MKIKCIGILTSGGDAPGMNAAIRAITRSAIYNGIRVKGIYRGYKGLMMGEIEEFHTESVSNIIQHGGTILRAQDVRNSTHRKEDRRLTPPYDRKASTHWLYVVETVRSPEPVCSLKSSTSRSSVCHALSTTTCLAQISQ